MYNVVAFLEKPKESDGFAEIINFLKASSVSYALTVNPVIYTSCIEQFWATAEEEEMGEDSDHPTDSTSIHILLINHLNSSEQFWATAKVQTVNGVRQIQALVDKKRVIITESSIRRDPQPSGEDSIKLTDLMVLCTKLQTQVLDLQKAKDAQAKEIDALKKRIQRLERRKISRPTGLKRLRKVDIDVDVDVSLVDETQERQDDDLIFDTGVLDDVEMPVEAKVDGKDEQSTKKLDDSTAGEAVTTAGDDSVVPTTNEEITLAQTLIQIKAAKPKVVTTAATTTTTTRPKDKGVVVQEPSEFRVPQEIKPSSSKDKGKGIMIEPEVPLKRKDQIALDEQIARDIQANWMLKGEELTNEEKGKLFMELMEKRRKHFAALRAQEKRNRPPTKAQKRTQMSTYFKHMGGFTYKQLKRKNFDEIQKLFDKEMRSNTFVAMGSEEQESKEKKAEGSEEITKGSRKKMLKRKRAGKQQQQESLKKQKMEEDKESDEVKDGSEDNEEELLKHLVIKKDEDIAINAIPLATKLLVIVYTSQKEGIDIEDLDVLWRIVKVKHNDTRLEDEFERVLWGDLKVMFEPDTTSDVWRIRKVNERFECIPPEYDEEFVIKKLEDSEAEHQV
ncbi:hypothetical protein Tco_1437745 [Tanacetum coccineum]